MREYRVQTYCGSSTFTPRALLDLANEDIRELDRVAVMLESDGSALWHVGQASALEHRLTIKIHSELVAFHRDDETIPLPDWLVGFDFWCHGRAHFCGNFLVRAIAIDFSRTGGPAPDIYLAFAVASQVNAAIA